MNKDEFFMKQAIALAKKANGFNNPNPMVGCVIVKDNVIISDGYHVQYGSNHAERNAILNVSPQELKDADIYITLEPCNHHGKTPPCLDLILKSNFKRVIVGSLDPHPYMSGKSIEILKQHQIETIVGVLKEECDDLIKEFAYFHTNKHPYVCAKLAMSLDGQIATKTGQSKWISNEESRKLVHLQRAKYTAIMVGVNTVLTDDPLLNVRLENYASPIRIIVDSNLKTPLNSQICQTTNKYLTYIVTTNVNPKLHQEYQRLGCHIIVANRDENQQVDLKELMQKLTDLNINSIYLEGGPTLINSFLRLHLINEFQFYIAPILIGNTNHYHAIHDLGITELHKAIKLKNIQLLRIQDDVLYSAEVEYV